MPAEGPSRYRCWVVIETGGNQRFVFTSNRLRHVVGGSQLLVESLSDDEDGRLARRRLPPEVEVVQSVSGKALLLVPDRALGQDVVRRVSAWALETAPGLDITGAVGLPFNADLPWDPDGAYPPAVPEPGDPERLDHVTALHDTFRRQRLARSARPAQHLRFRGLPWHLSCHETGLPAAGFERYGTDDVQPVSDTAIARMDRARGRAETRLAELLRAPGLTEPPRAPDIVDQLTQDGWIAVVHADGNHVGTLMSRFPELVASVVAEAGEGSPGGLTLSDHTRYLRKVSRELDTATRNAFTAAVASALADETWTEKRPVLPVVVGGDDVTFLCHADLALPITRAFLARFAEETARTSCLAALVRAYQPGARGLTAAAGIAFVKRHHPFAYAVQLAEELTTSAKTGTRPPLPQTGEPPEAAAVTTAPRTGLGTSAYDVHVAHEATLRPLSAMRVLRARDGVAGHAGPFVLGGPDPLPAHLQARHERHLLDVVDMLVSRDGSAPRAFSAARAHDLRDAFDRGLPAYQQRLEVAASAVEDPQRLRRLLEERQAPACTGEPDGIARVDRFLLLPDAMLLCGISRHQFPARMTEVSA